MTSFHTTSTIHIIYSGMFLHCYNHTHFNFSLQYHRLKNILLACLFFAAVLHAQSHKNEHSTYPLKQFMRFCPNQKQVSEKVTVNAAIGTFTLCTELILLLFVMIFIDNPQLLSPLLCNTLSFQHHRLKNK